MRFGIVGRMGPWIRQVVGFGDRSTEKGNFGGECGAPRCNEWGVRRGLLPNYFGQSCFNWSNYCRSYWSSETVEPIEMPFPGRLCGPRNHVIAGGPDPTRKGGGLLRGDASQVPLHDGLVQSWHLPRSTTGQH